MSKCGGFCLLGGVINGKLHEPLLFVSGARISGKQELINQMIQGASERVNHFPSNVGDSEGHRFDAAQAIEDYSRLRIMLGDNFVWLGVAEGPNFRIEFPELFFGPFGLLPDNFQSSHFCIPESGNLMPRPIAQQDSKRDL